MPSSELPLNGAADTDSVPVAPVVLLAARPQPRLPAWARLLVYLITAIVVGVVGNIVGSIPGVVAVMSGPNAPKGLFSPDGLDGDGLLAALPAWSVILMSYCTFVPVAGVTLVFARFIDRRSWAEIGLVFRPATRRELLIGALLGSTVVVQTLGYAAFGLVDLDRTEHSVLAAAVSGLILFAGVGFWEELIFRGYLLPNAEALAGRVGGILISSILFWSVHLMTPEARDPLTGLGLFLMGVLFSLCYYGSGSLWLGIAMHASYDFLLVSLFQPHSQINVPTVYSMDVLAPPWLVGPPGKAGLLDMAWLVVMLFGVYGWLYRPARRPPHPQPLSPQTGQGE